MYVVILGQNNVIDSNKTVRELLEAGSQNHVTKPTALSIPKKDGSTGPFIQCQFCPFKVCQNTHTFYLC